MAYHIRVVIKSSPDVNVVQNLYLSLLALHSFCRSYHRLHETELSYSPHTHNLLSLHMARRCPLTSTTIKEGTSGVPPPPRYRSGGSPDLPHIATPTPDLTLIAAPPTCSLISTLAPRPTGTQAVTVRADLSRGLGN